MSWLWVGDKYFVCSLLDTGNLLWMLSSGLQNKDLLCDSTCWKENTALHQRFWFLHLDSTCYQECFPFKAGQMKCHGINQFPLVLEQSRNISMKWIICCGIDNVVFLAVQLTAQYVTLLLTDWVTDWVTFWFWNIRQAIG